MAKGWTWRRPIALALPLLLGGAAAVYFAGRDTRPAATPPSSSPASPPLVSAPTLSMSEILAGHSDDWRLARLQDIPEVLVIEFPGLGEQGAALNRVAALLEKADTPHDRVLDNAELAAAVARSGDNTQTYYQGHDYDGAGLARFHERVRLQGLPLNPQELRLRGLLTAHGLLRETANGWQAMGSQALISFTSIQADDPTTPLDESIDERRRESVLRHEASHGRYFTRPVYREHCRRFWNSALTDRQRQAFRTYLAKLGYDRLNEDLMVNEAQAFLFHTPDTRAFRPEDVGMTPLQLSELRTRFWRSLPDDSPSLSSHAVPRIER